MISTGAMDKIEGFCRSKQVIVAAYVFGSSATDRNRGGSDIDIAIMIRGRMDGFERVQLETDLANVLGKDVDLVVFGQATPLLQHQILKYGRLVHEADPKERVRQETAARRQYLDSLSLYRVLGKDKTHGG